MNNDIALKSHAEYVRELKALMPPVAFEPNRKRLIHLAIHFAILFVGYISIRYSSNIFLLLLSSLVIGHSMMCISWLAHETSHHTVVRSPTFRYLIEIGAWGILAIPTTIWTRVHNNTHHIHANTPEDPDRKMMEDEKTILRSIYEVMLFPNRKFLKFNPFVGLTFITYNLTNVISAFLPNEKKMAFTRVKPKYKSIHLLKAAVEIAVICVLYYGVFQIVGSWFHFFFAGPLSWMIGSLMAMAYIHTNHFDNPMCETNDPVLSTTSVIVPKWVDFIHINFSYHTEHHVFPNMNSDYYPMLSTLLLERYPERYTRRPFLAVWGSLWKHPVYVKRADVVPRNEKRLIESGIHD